MASLRQTETFQLQTAHKFPLVLLLLLEAGCCFLFAVCLYVRVFGTSGPNESPPPGIMQLVSALVLIYSDKIPATIDAYTASITSNLPPQVHHPDTYPDELLTPCEY